MTSASIGNAGEQLYHEMLGRIVQYCEEHFPGEHANIGWGESWDEDGIGISTKVGGRMVVMADGDFATGEITISHGELGLRTGPDPGER